MHRNYNDWLKKAQKSKYYLNDAISNKDEKKILYYRGKYLSYLKHAHKENPNGTISPFISGLSNALPIEDVINEELKNHQKQIEVSLINNKKNSSIKNKTLSKEIGLKIRRLSTRYNQINFATGAFERKNIKKEMLKDSAGLAGTAIKAPFMATAKVASVAGPLLIGLTFLPLRLVAAGLSVTMDISNGKVVKENPYNSTCIAKLTDDLKNGLKEISKQTYEHVGKI